MTLRQRIVLDENKVPMQLQTSRIWAASTPICRLTHLQVHSQLALWRQAMQAVQLLVEQLQQRYPLLLLEQHLVSCYIGAALESQGSQRPLQLWHMSGRPGSKVPPGIAYRLKPLLLQRHQHHTELQQGTLVNTTSSSQHHIKQPEETPADASSCFSPPS